MALKIKKHDPSKLGETDRSKYSGYSDHPLKRSTTRNYKNKKGKTPVKSRRSSTAVNIDDDFKLRKGVDLFGKIATKEDAGPGKKLSKMTPRSSFDRHTNVPYAVKDEEVE